MRQLPLIEFPTAPKGKSAPASPSPPPRRKGPPPLWLAIHLPELPLEVSGSGERERPVAVFEERGGKRWITALSTAAREAGVEEGMSLEAACALCGELILHPRDTTAERRRLERLATVAGRFTSWVALEPPQALLLEIGASLALFGGIEPLWQRLRRALQERQTGRFHHAVTPTPLASLWLARCGETRVITCLEKVRPALGELPLQVLGLEPRQEERLRNTGVRTLRDLWRLPRKGLARRFGPPLLQMLDCALGEADDPRGHHAPPLRFRSTLELPVESREIPLLREGAKRLLARLTIFLRRHDAAVEHLRFGLQANGQAVRWLNLGLCRGQQDGEHLLALFELRLERVRLEAPVRTLILESRAIRPFEARNRSLLRIAETTRYREEEWQELLEQLQSRLGPENLFLLRSLPDHRPERAWKRTGPGNPDHDPPYRISRRPLWLLPEPRPLPTRERRPRRLTLQEGPERIESGWWSGSHIRRDYYTARDREGRRLWVFHDLKRPGHWYLHGLFG